MEEIWKDIYYVDSISGEVVDFRGIYQVSNTGKIKSLEKTARVCGGGIRVIKERIMKGWIDNNGYTQVALTKDKKDKKFRVHRLVAHMFIPNPDNKPEVDHIIPISNGGTNDVANLRWATSKENVNNELSIINKSGENHPFYNKTGKDNPVSKKIARYDYNINLLDVWIGVQEAQRTLKIYHISDACSGKRNSAGKDENGNPYYWKYID